MRKTTWQHRARILSGSFVLSVLLACGGSSEPPPPVATLDLLPANDTVRVGETTQLTATTKDADGNVLTGRTISWSSGSPGVASVSETGLVTGVADGTAIVTATSENKTGSASIRVFGVCSTALAPTITVGQTINGALATTDCKLTDNTYADGYGIMVTTATPVQIDMTASFDTYLVLLELTTAGDLEQRAFNDDVDPDDPADPNDPVDTNSRIAFALQPGVQYFILANSFDPNITGDYQLKVVQTAFTSTPSVIGKPGKAPISSLIKTLRPPR